MESLLLPPQAAMPSAAASAMVAMPTRGTKRGRPLLLLIELLCPFLIDFVDKKAATVPELSTFWIENLLIPYRIRGNAYESDWKTRDERGKGASEGLTEGPLRTTRSGS